MKKTETKKLSELCDIKTGKKDANHAVPDGQYRFYTCASNYSMCNTKSFSGPSVIVPGNGDIGLVFFYDGEFDAYQRTYVLCNIKIVPKYLYYHLCHRWRERNSDKQFGSTVRYVRMANFTSYEVPVLSLPEQERIVARIEELFSQLDTGVETLKKTKEQLAVYRQAVLKEAFESVEGTSGVLGEYIVEKPRNGYSPKPVKHKTPYKNLTLTATTGGVFKPGYYKYIDIDIDTNSYLWVKRNDILIQRANTIEYVGTAAIYTGEDNLYVYPDLMMKCHPVKGILPQFLLYQLHFQRMIGYYRKNATGTAGSMPKINQTIVCNTPIVMTSIEKQQLTVSQIESRLSVCDNIEQTVDAALQEAEALRQSILKKAFSGEL